MASERLVIRRERHPWRNLTLAAVALAVGATAVIAAYRLGVERGVGEAAAAVAERGELQRRVRGLGERLAGVQVEMARMQSAQRIDREAYDEVRASLGEVQQQNLELREELEFYRNVVAPSQDGPELQVQRFELEPAIGPGQYRYQLTLIHIQGARSRQSVASGRVELYVDGTLEGRARRLSLEELTSPESAELKYAIRYFKNFEGELRLPEGFRPHSASVAVVPDGQDGAALEKRIRWPGAASG